MTSIVASISAHGFGHMAITAPVLERLHASHPEWALIVSTGLPKGVLKRRISCPFELTGEELDFGLRMNPDLSVNVAATLADYSDIHERWTDRVGRRADWLAGLGCGLLLSNISYLNIAAAAEAGIPVIALSPLNWADLYRYYAPDTPDCRTVFEQMVGAYRAADVFLAPEPCMPMPNFDNVEVIPPVVQTGRDHRSRVCEVFGLSDAAALMLLALGGQESSMQVDELPLIDGAYWLAERRWELERADILPLDDTGLAFPDLLASCDLLVCKPGYGAFAEAACLGKPVVYLRRPGWPEEIHLIEWLQRQVTCREAPRGNARGLRDPILELLQVGTGGGCPAKGVDVSVRRVEALVR